MLAKHGKQWDEQLGFIAIAEQESEGCVVEKLIDRFFSNQFTEE